MLNDTRKQIFHEALLRSESDRQEYVERRCDGDDRLRLDVEKLLLAHDAAGDFMLEPTSGGDPIVFEAPPARESPGDVLGPYKLISKLGEGGFGTVYLAEQTQHVHRQVAIKILKPGLETGQVMRRFEAERQALALMDHPAIASVFDAGTSESGRPYVVMEYVDGQTVLEYCNNRRLSIRQRLDVFEQICHAVQHAHQKGVIHRDLKPGNVLITEVDGRPVPKIIDFGIAKAVARKLTEQTLVTEQAQILGTPEYMSPEQAALGGEDIDTRSDIYSLGVLLYELLVGLPPFNRSRLRAASFTEIIRIVREQEPARPSLRLGGLARLGIRTAQDSTEPSADAVSMDRRTDPDSMRRALRRDLDWIVMKAIEKDRGRRYQGASELAADIRRHLNDEPVEAGPPSKLYRMSKFIRRHRMGIVSVSVMVVALIATVVLSLVFAAVAIDARDEAEMELARTQAISQFTQTMLEGVDPATARGADTSLMRTILDRATDRVGAELADKPEVAGPVYLTIGRSYNSIAAHEEAERAYSSAHRLGLMYHDDELVGDAQSGLASVYVATSRFREAHLILREVLKRRVEVYGAEAPDTIQAESNLAAVLRQMGRWDEAAERFRHVLDVRTRTLGEDDDSTVASMNNLATLYDQMGRSEDAVGLLQHVVDHQKVNLGPDHPRTLMTMNNLAMACERVNQVERSMELLVDVIDIKRGVLGDEHPSLLISLNNLACLYRDNDRPDEAEEMLAGALEIAKRTLGDDHITTLGITKSLAETWRVQGRNEESASRLAVVRLSMIDRLGDRHPYVLATTASLAESLVAAGRADEALESIDTSLDLTREAFGPDNIRMARIQLTRAKVLSELERSSEAEEALTNAERIFEAAPQGRKGLEKCANLRASWQSND